MPPDKKRTAGPAAKPGPTATNASPHQKDQQHQSKRQCGRHADTFRWGFACGFRDALRLAARRLPPETWSTLEALACDYELVSDD